MHKYVQAWDGWWKQETEDVSWMSEGFVMGGNVSGLERDSGKDEESVWELRRKVGLQAMITAWPIYAIPLGDKMQVLVFLD